MLQDLTPADQASASRSHMLPMLLTHQRSGPRTLSTVCIRLRQRSRRCGRCPAAIRGGRRCPGRYLAAALLLKPVPKFGRTGRPSRRRRTRRSLGRRSSSQCPGVTGPPPRLSVWLGQAPRSRHERAQSHSVSAHGTLRYRASNGSPKRPSSRAEISSVIPFGTVISVAKPSSARILSKVTL